MNIFGGQGVCVYFFTKRKNKINGILGLGKKLFKACEILTNRENVPTRGVRIK